MRSANKLSGILRTIPECATFNLPRHGISFSIIDNGQKRTWQHTWYLAESVFVSFQKCEFILHRDDPAVTLREKRTVKGCRVVMNADDLLEDRRQGSVNRILGKIPKKREDAQL